MTTELEYKTRIQSYNAAQLHELWQSIQKRNTTSDWEKGKALEYFVLRAFELENAEVRYPYSVPMNDSNNPLEQIDGVVYVQSIACIIECKDTKESEALAKYHMM